MAKIKMAKEIVEVTRRTHEGLITQLYFDSEFNIIKEKINGIFKAEIETTNVYESDTNLFYYKTTNRLITAKNIVAITPESAIKHKYGDALSAHFDMINKIKQCYLK